MTPFPFLDVPIVGAPMGGVTTPALVAAVSGAGGLGSLACAYSDPATIAADAAAVRALTALPFAMNLFVESVHTRPPAEKLARAHERLRAYRDELGLAQPPQPAEPPQHYAGQIEALLAARPAVFSFTFGIPAPGVLARCRAAGIVTVGTATTVDEARSLEDAGVDAVCVQGSEAGAHRGTFLGPVEDALIGTVALVPLVVDAIRLPVIAAGGIGDGRGVAAVLALGASAAQVGSALLLTDEAGTAPAYRAALRSAANRRTTITTVFSGRAARGIVNRAIEELHVDDVAPYPWQNAFTRDIRNAAARAGRAEFLSLWAGQAAALARAEPAAATVARLVDEARAAARRAAAAAGDRHDL